MAFLHPALLWFRLKGPVVLALALAFCNVNFEFSEAQGSTIAITSTQEPACDSTTQCFLDATQLDSLLNCTFLAFGETDPPCYGLWTSASSCSCLDPSYTISSVGATYWCESDGSWGSTFYDLRCQAPCSTDAAVNAIPRRSDGIVSRTIKHGDFVTYTCPEGYSGSGTQKVDCNDGAWEPHEIFNCTEINTVIGFTTSPMATEATDNITAIPMTTVDYVTSEAGNILVSNDASTMKTMKAELPTILSILPTTLDTAATLSVTSLPMDKTTSTDITDPLMETMSSVHSTARTTSVVVPTTHVITTTVDGDNSYHTTIPTKSSSKVTTPNDESTHDPATNPGTILPSVKVTYWTTNVYQMCPSEELYFSGIQLTFLATVSETSTHSIEVCGMNSEKASTPLARRNCTEGHWDEPLLFQCYSQDAVAEAILNISTVNVTTKNVEEIAREVTILTSQTDDLTSNEVDHVGNILQAIVETGSSSPNVTRSVVGTVNNIMEVEEDELEQTGGTNAIIMSLERQISNTQKNPGNFTDIQNNVGVKAVKVDSSIAQAITFINVAPDDKTDEEGLNDDLSVQNALLFNDAEETERRHTTTSIYLPPKVLELAQRANQEFQKIPFSFFIYKDSRLFQTNSKKGEEVVSQVIAATLEIDNITISGLDPEDAIITRFLTKNLTANSTTIMTRRCVFWKVSEEEQVSGSWSTEGCKMIPESSDMRYTVCQCSHLTSFAVIYRFENTIYRPTASLDILTKIGTSLSIVGLTGCILTLTLIKESRKKQPARLHINLCLCLIGFYATFMAGDLAKGNSRHCKRLASATQYFCLATVAWTCAEAVNMYFLFVKYSMTKIRYYVLGSCILCYGLPLAPTITVYLLDNTTLEDYCFLHPGNFLYFGLLLEILIMLIFNIVVFSLVVQRVTCRPILSTNGQNNKRKEVIARIQQFALFWILLGLSWAFGFLLIIPTWRFVTLVFEILFCVFTSVQGFILFLFICLKNPEVKKIFKRVKRRFKKSDSYWMKNRKGCYSVSDFHSRMDSRKTRVALSYINHAVSEESEFSVSEQTDNKEATLQTNSIQNDNMLESEKHVDENLEPEVKEMDSGKEETMVRDYSAVESRSSFRPNVARNNSEMGGEKVKKKVIFV